MRRADRSPARAPLPRHRRRACDSTERIGAHPSSRRGTGRRLAVKDLFDTAGVRTTYGSASSPTTCPQATAPAVALLEAAGYVNVGKANLHEFAWGITSENPHYGTVPNPLAPGRIAGGSSGGNAAALALGLADAALGTRLRRLDPHPRRLLRRRRLQADVRARADRAAASRSRRASTTSGPMARDVAECERMMGALAPGFEPVGARRRWAICRSASRGRSGADPLVRARVEAGGGASRRAARLELPLPGDVGPAFAREVADVHAELFARAPRALRRERGDEARARAGGWTTTGSAAAVAERERYRERMAERDGGRRPRRDADAQDGRAAASGSATSRCATA